MILNVWSLTALFLTVVSAALALATAVAARRKSTESRANFLALVVGTLFVVKLVSWPSFYLLLKSYVPDFEALGVMCTYGVTRIEPELVRALEIVKPLTLFALGLWGLVEWVNRRAAERRLSGPGFVLSLLTATLVLGECALELAYLFAEKGGSAVTCCSQFLSSTVSTLRPETDTFSVEFGATGAASLVAMLLLHGALIVLGLRVAARLRAGVMPYSGMRPTLLAATAFVNLAVTHIAWQDSVAPRVLQLPYHHCVYELLTDLPVMGFAALLTVSGSACLVWPAILGAWAKRAPAENTSIQERLYRLGARALASALLIVAILMV